MCRGSARCCRKSRENVAESSTEQSCHQQTHLSASDVNHPAESNTFFCFLSAACARPPFHSAVSPQFRQSRTDSGGSSLTQSQTANNTTYVGTCFILRMFSGCFYWSINNTYFYVFLNSKICFYNYGIVIKTIADVFRFPRQKSADGVIRKRRKLPLLSARPAVTLPASERRCPWPVERTCERGARSPKSSTARCSNIMHATTFETVPRVLTCFIAVDCRQRRVTAVDGHCAP